jgi:hypothetical protein
LAETPTALEQHIDGRPAARNRVLRWAGYTVVPWRRSFYLKKQYPGDKKSHLGLVCAGKSDNSPNPFGARADFGISSQFRA